MDEIQQKFSSMAVNTSKFTGISSVQPDKL